MGTLGLSHSHELRLHPPSRNPLLIAGQSELSAALDLRPAVCILVSRKGDAIIKRACKHPLLHACLRAFLITFVIGVSVLIGAACEPRQSVVEPERQDQPRPVDPHPNRGDEMFISADQALEMASEEIRRFLLQGDSMFAPWSDASLGQPLLVKDVFRNPSYWLVPVLIQERVAGFVRVLGTGEAAAIGAFYRDPNYLEDCPAVITGIDALEASNRAEERIQLEQGEVALDPVFVHDGPQGREAWLIEIVKEGSPYRWIFVTPAFVYERPAGELLDETME